MPIKTEIIENYLADLQGILNQLPLENLQAVIDILLKARLEGRQVFIMGNGGSAATASHFVCDLVKNTRQVGLPPMRVIGLGDNPATLTAYANDEGYENAFAKHLASFVKPGDVVIGISTSGKSLNVIRAIELANQSDAITIGFTGKTGGQLAHLVDIDLRVPTDCVQYLEDIHLMLEHIITRTLCEHSEDVGSTPLYLKIKAEKAV